MTKTRQTTLDILRNAKEPLSASAIFQLIDDRCDPVTVYRTLHYLEEQGLADSFILHCDEHGTERYYTACGDCEGKHGLHHHWFHCEKCHCFIDLGNCKLDSLVASYEHDLGLVVSSHTLYLTGLCNNCRDSR